MLRRPRKGISDKQLKLLKTIKEHIDEYGYSPSMRELADTLGISSSSSILVMLERLERDGFIKRIPHANRSVRIIEEKYPYNDSKPKKSKDFLQVDERGIPILGHIVAGLPVMCEENYEGHFAVSEFLNNSNGGFFLIVDGFSMKDKGILPGDYVFIKPVKEISNGQIGAFRLNGEITLKTFKRTENGISLLPANNEFTPIIVGKNDEFEVIGRYVMLLRLPEKKYNSFY